MQPFDIHHFRAEFARVIESITAKLAELDLAGDLLHRQVAGFRGRAR